MHLAYGPCVGPCVAARLESYFGCLWAANSFSTPAGMQGFKAHHDEVEVFMLQLSGAKRWRLHACPSGPLPRSYCRVPSIEFSFKGIYLYQ